MADTTIGGYRVIDIVGRSATAYPIGGESGDHRYWTVMLDVDPGIGSMMSTRIARSLLTFTGEQPPPTPLESR